MEQRTSAAARIFFAILTIFLAFERPTLYETLTAISWVAISIRKSHSEQCTGYWTESLDQALPTDGAAFGAD